MHQQPFDQPAPFIPRHGFGSVLLLVAVALVGSACGGPAEPVGVAEGEAYAGRCTVGGPLHALAGFIDEPGVDLPEDRSGGFLDLLFSPDPITCDQFRAHVANGGPVDTKRFRGFSVLLFDAPTESGTWLQPDRLGRYRPYDTALDGSTSLFLTYVFTPECPVPFGLFDYANGQVHLDAIDRAPGGTIRGAVESSAKLLDPEGRPHWRMKASFSAKVCDVRNVVVGR